MTTRSLERTFERRSQRSRWLLAISVGSGLAVIAFLLAIFAIRQAHNQDLAVLSPAPIPVPPAPTTEQQFYPAATPAASALAAEKPQPEWVAVPMPPVSDAPF